MSIVMKRMVKGIVAVVLMCGIAVTFPAIGSRTLDQRANAWVESHADRLPASLDAINQFPVEYQRAIYAALTPAQRAGIWREHLLRVAGAGSELTPRQREFVRTFAATISAQDFAPGAQYSPATAALMKQIQPALQTRATIIAPGAWRTMIPVNPWRGGVRTALGAARVRLTEFVIGKATASAQDEYGGDPNLPNCQCWSEEGGKYNCEEREGYKKSCPRTPSGDRATCRVINDVYTGPCSWSESRPCDGLCRYEVANGGDPWEDNGEYESNECRVHDMADCPDSCDQGCWVR